MIRGRSGPGAFIAIGRRNHAREGTAHGDDGDHQLGREGSAAGEQLLVGWRPLTASDADTSSEAVTESEHRAALLDHIQEAAFAYFGAAQTEDTPTWHPTWQNMNYLPSLI